MIRTYILIYVFASEIFGVGENKDQFVKSLITEFLPIGVTFIISYFVFRRVQKLKEEQAVSDLSEGIAKGILPRIESILDSTPTQGYMVVDFLKVPWEKHLAGAMRVDIIVHYFDTWIRNNEAYLEDVFKRGGTIRIIVPNHTNYNLVNSIKQRFPEYTYNQIKDKIESTNKKLNLIYKRIGKGTLEVYQINEMPYYCGVRIDERSFILSIYDHIRGKMRIEAPTFLFDLSKQPQINSWFEKELTGLISNSTIVANS